MLAFKTKPRKWGNSLGITIPKEIVEKGGLASDEEVEIFIVRRKAIDTQALFGSLNAAFARKKIKKSTQQLLDELDEDGA